MFLIDSQVTFGSAMGFVELTVEVIHEFGAVHQFVKRAGMNQVDQLLTLLSVNQREGGSPCRPVHSRIVDEVQVGENLIPHLRVIARVLRYYVRNYPIVTLHLADPPVDCRETSLFSLSSITGTFLV